MGKTDNFKDEEVVSNEELNKLMNDFINQYNRDVSYEFDDKLLKTMQTFEKALNAGDEKKAIKLAKEAIKIDPTYIEAKLFLIPHEYHGERLLDELNKVVDEEKERLTKDGFFKGGKDFYLMWETRAYMTALQNKAMVLIQYGKITLAKKVLEEMLEINKNDNLGARYMLAAVYAYFEDEESFNKLLMTYKNSTSVSFLISKLCLYYKLGDNDKVKQILKEINKANSHFKEVILNDITDEDLYELKSGYFQVGERSEIVEFVVSCEFLILSCPGVLEFIKEL